MHGWALHCSITAIHTAVTGLGLGYLYARYDCGALCGSASTGGVYLVGRLGMRYFMNQKTAFYADVGAGAASLDVGLVFKLK